MRVVLLNLAAKLSDTEQLSLPEELDASTVLEKLTRLRKCHNIILKSGATELTHYSPLFNYLQYTVSVSIKLSALVYDPYVYEGCPAHTPKLNTRFKSS